MKGFSPLLATVAFAAVTFPAFLLTPKIRNMRVEYRTAEAIRDITNHLRSHGGEWPSSPSQLGNRYPEDGEVRIDYSMTSGRILANPALLERAVRPVSGKFRTYPHLRQDLESLLAVLRKTHKSDEEISPEIRR